MRKLKVFPLRSRRRQGVHFLHTKIALEVLARATKQKQIINKRNEVRKTSK